MAQTANRSRYSRTRARGSPRAQQIADHGNRVGARANDVGRPIERDAANRHHARAHADAREPPPAPPSRFRPRRTPWPSKPCRRPGRSRRSRPAACTAASSCAIVCVERPMMRCGTDDRRAASGGRSSWPTWTPAAPASRATSARSFDDELRTEARCHRHDGFRGLEQPAARGVLRPELEERRAAVETGAGKIEHTPAGARGGVSVDDGVQARKQPAARGSGGCVTRPPQRGGPG